MFFCTQLSLCEYILKNVSNNKSMFFFSVVSDDIYAYALSKTLTKVSSPATVGLYSTCQNRINMILRQLEGMLPRGALTGWLFCLLIGSCLCDFVNRTAVFFFFLIVMTVCLCLCSVFWAHSSMFSVNMTAAECWLYKLYLLTTKKCWVSTSSQHCQSFLPTFRKWDSHVSACKWLVHHLRAGSHLADWLKTGHITLLVSRGLLRLYTPIPEHTCSYTYIPGLITCF